VSEAATIAYWGRKGVVVYPDNAGARGIYWDIPQDQQPPIGAYRITKGAPEDAACIAANAAYNLHTLRIERSVQRHDPDLVAVVEQMGARANDRFSDLKVVEIPDNVDYEIQEYDGQETIAECHRTWS